MAAGSTYTPIATTTLGSATSSYTFTSIPTTYTDLILVASGYTNGDPVFIQVGNGSVDTGSNYSYTTLFGDGSSTASGRTSSQGYGGYGLVDAAGYFSLNVAFQNYANTSTYKTFLVRSGKGASNVFSSVNLWRSTSAINTIKIYAFYGSNFNTGTTFTLYGIQAA